MAAYDRLPAVVRRAIREARFTYSPISAEMMLVRYRLSPEMVAELIREDDAEMMIKTKRVWEYKP